MARRTNAEKLEDELAALRTLAAAGPSPALESALSSALSSRPSFIASQAAKYAKTHHLRALEDDLVAAFHRFMENPIDSDKGCLVKLSIVETLVELGHTGSTVFLAGVRHHQPEPSWGERGWELHDTAHNLRATCAQALVLIAWPGARIELVRLLSDPELQPRTTAVAELAALGGEADLLLLQLVLQMGGTDDDAIALRGDCMHALLQRPDLYLADVAAYLHDPAVGHLAALAIGQSRDPRAYPILRAAWDSHLRATDRQPLILPLALTRDPAAFDLLLDRLTPRPDTMAEDIINALAICYPGTDHRARLHAAVLATADDRLIHTHHTLTT